MRPRLIMALIALSVQCHADTESMSYYSGKQGHEVSAQEYQNYQTYVEEQNQAFIDENARRPTHLDDTWRGDDTGTDAAANFSNRWDQ